MVTSPSNSRFKEARKLQQKRHRTETGRFLVEGVRLISDALQSGLRPEYLFYAPELLSPNRAATALVAQLAGEGVRSLPTTPLLLGELSATVTPQGIVAVMPVPALRPPANPTLTLVLDQLREPGNAGALLRTAEAAGVAFVIFTAGTVDPFNDKVVRAGMGAHFRLPLSVCEDWASVERMLPPKQPVYLAETRAKLAYDQVDWRAPAILVVGGEAGGASTHLRSISRPIAIPMHGQVESLNAAVAGAVILFEAARQRRAG
jgi:TrmH family RNA methyltransferase